MAFYFSKSTSGFYSDSLKSSYDAASTWPNDAIEITEIEYQSLLIGQAEGKIIITGKDGMPFLQENSKKDINGLKIKYNKLLNDAEKIIAPLRDEALIDIISSDDREKLTLWVEYCKKLRKTDLNSDNIIWPTPPT